VTEPADFIDAALQYEVSPYVWPDETDGLQRYGTSVGAVRGTVRDALKRYPGMSHDEIMSLSSELWSVPVAERRQAAIVLLQTHVDLLVANDLTRIEGFVRSSSTALVDQLVTDVIEPMLAKMDAAARAKVDVVLRRWVSAKLLPVFPHG
jgi:DNA alkylation repair enzyme